MLGGGVWGKNGVGQRRGKGVIRQSRVIDRKGDGGWNNKEAEEGEKRYGGGGNKKIIKKGGEWGVSAHERK